MKEILKRIYILCLFVGVSRRIFEWFSLNYLKHQWRMVNGHNKTRIMKKFDMDNVKVGNFTYGELNVHSWGVQGESLIIGNYVSIADNVVFILSGNHTVNGFTTFPMKSHKSNIIHPDDARTKGPIIIEDNVWIGFGSIILSGVTVGKGSIVAAGAVVTKSFPPYSIIGGNPARLIKSRLTDAQIDICNEISFKSIDLDAISNEDIERFYKQP